MNPLKNAILAALPPDDYQALLPKLTLVSLHPGQTLFEVGDVPAHVHFPVGSIISMMNDLPDGQSIEVHMLGNTCMVGVAAIDCPSFYRASVRLAGLAYRLEISELRLLRARCPAYFAEAQKRTGLLMSHISQRLVCVKHHSMEQQLIRWMMLMLDRQLDNMIHVTHDELSSLHGIRREAVTLALGSLAKQGLVSQRRGMIQVLDRSALETISCGCYWSALGKAHPEPAHNTGAMKRAHHREIPKVSLKL